MMSVGVGYVHFRDYVIANCRTIGPYEGSDYYRDTSGEPKTFQTDGSNRNYGEDVRSPLGAGENVTSR